MSTQEVSQEKQEEIKQITEKIIKIIEVEKKKLTYVQINKFIKKELIDLGYDLESKEDKNFAKHVKNVVISDRNIRKLTGIRNLPLRWFKFYVYFLLPLATVLMILGGFIPELAILPFEKPENINLGILAFLTAAFCFVQFWGLVKYKRWGLMLFFVNWGLTSIVVFSAIGIGISAVIHKESDAIYVFPFFVIYVIYIIFNWRYFAKRSYLFS